ncbi:MAG: cyclopropane fatty acyl phospholipid synthase [Burkholderiaceae bacterium]
MLNPTRIALVDQPLRNSRFERRAQPLLAQADIRLNGSRPWDLQIHHPETLERVFLTGSLGLGESYMEGWWDCHQLDGFFERVLRHGLERHVRSVNPLMHFIKSHWGNAQSIRRAWTVGREHYDLDQALFQHMLDPTLCYSCGYWEQADTLEQAQRAKLALICRKLQLEPGMTLLDIGCGWGSLMRYAATHYQVSCVGLTISREQASAAAVLDRHLPIRYELTDYRQFNTDGHHQFDRIASVGMFEHVGLQNHMEYFDTALRCLKPDGLFLLHTIGKNQSQLPIDPWIEKYIFPNGELPSLQELMRSTERHWVIEDVHNFGADYDRTLMAWYERFQQVWPKIKDHHSDRFYRMWSYYLLSCAGTFRARSNQLWQLVLSPQGVRGGYRRPTTPC